MRLYVKEQRYGGAADEEIAWEEAGHATTIQVAEQARMIGKQQNKWGSILLAVICKRIGMG